ncbi:pentatricopeptide (PPR) repeat-containing protein [Euphorbia peplus]|nr:pentatricopeptide (PPR) repeat-containing protein [Euphorbia peplus]
MMKSFGLSIKAMSNGDSDNGVVGGGLLEKDLEFKPSFDEYLKAMESIKTVREKKIQHKPSGRKLKDDSKRNNTTMLGRTERSPKLRLQEFVDEETTSGIVENDKLRKKGNADVAREYTSSGKRDYKGRLTRESNVKFVKQSNGDSNVKKSTRGAKREDGLSNKQSSNLNALLDLNQDKNKKIQNLQRIPVVVGDVRRNKSTRSTNEDFSYRQSSPKILQGNDRVIEGGEIVLQNNKISDKFVRNQVEIVKNSDKEFMDKKGLSSRRNQVLIDNGGAEDLEVERAAFRSLGEYNNIDFKPRSKMEIEDRLQKLSQCLNGADIDIPEWMFGKMMRSARIKYTDHSIVRIIQILGKFGNWRRVLQVIEWLQMRERFKSHKLRFIYTTALNVLGKAQRPVEALNLFHAMQQQMSSYPDLVAYHCIAVALGQAGHMEQLFDVIDSMRSPPKKKFKMLEKWDPRLEPDIVVFNAVLNACVQRKQWEGAFWVIQQLKQQGIQPSTATYGLIMEVMFASGKYNLVHDFFRKVKKSSIPNALVYKVLVNTLGKEGKPDEAVLAVQDMERRGIVGSAALYYDLARCLCDAGRCQEALLQIEKICKVANKPLVVTLTGLLQACLDSGNIENAVYIFKQMKQFCSPNLVTCNVMLKAYLEHGLFEEAKELFHKMREDSSNIRSVDDYKIRVMPDIYSFNLMLDACITKNIWEDFEDVYGSMLYHGHHFNGKRHLRMILDASRAGKGKALEMTWKHLAATKRIPPAALIRERFCLMVEKEDIRSAVACITSKDMQVEGFCRDSWLNLFKENAQRFTRASVVKLMWEASDAVDRLKTNSSPNPNSVIVLQNLFTSCNDFLKTHSRLLQVNSSKS